MALMQIAEPGHDRKPREYVRAWGIDLGTTHSLVASVDEAGCATTAADAAGEDLMPSVVCYRDQGVEVGTGALEAVADAGNRILSVKRMLGRSLEELTAVPGPYRFVAGERGLPLLVTAAGRVSPVQVSAEILGALRRRAEDKFGCSLAGVVITVPAHFDDSQRQATRMAAELAGLKVLRLLNEPTAAALAYGLDQDGAGRRILIYDLGGGTFDVSILHYSRGLFEVLATGGDTALGGDDMDRVVADWVVAQTGKAPADATALVQLLALSRAAREALSKDGQLEYELAHADWRATLDRATLAKLVQPLLASTRKACRRALRDAGLSAKELDAVVLVGGTTRMPAVRELVGEFFGRPPLDSVDPDRVVALGAAIQADALAGNRRDDAALLLDVLPLSLGIETMGGLMEGVIPRNTPIPVNRAQEFTTGRDGQTGISIHVLQGERELVRDCRSLARFDLRGLPSMAAGAARIRVGFQVDADGLLRVTARETTSGIESDIEVVPSFGLTDGEITAMLKASQSLAREDAEARRLQELRVEAEQLADALRHAMEVDGEELLLAGEREQFDTALAELDALVAGEEPGAIKVTIGELNRLSEGFAQRRMDSAIRRALAGRDLAELEREG